MTKYHSPAYFIPAECCISCSNRWSIVNAFAWSVSAWMQYWEMPNRAKFTQRMSVCVYSVALDQTVLAPRCCLLITRYVWVRIADTISRFCSWNFIHRTISAENGSWNSNRCISLQSCIEFRWSRMSGAKVKRRLKFSLFIRINPFVNHQLFIVRHFK